MDKPFVRYKYFLIVSACFIVYLLGLTLVLGRTEAFFYLHIWGHPHLDGFFKFFSFLGDGWMGIPLAILLLLFGNFRWLLCFALSLGITAAITQTLKRTLFSDILRPIGEFGADSLEIAEGVRMHDYFSFPSGHTTAGFAIFIGLALLFKQKPIWQFFCAICACLVGYSRVYLAQHFPQDLVAGAAIAIVVSMLILKWSSKWKSPKWNNTLFGW